MTEQVALLDVNVLVALALDTHVHHRAAHRALAGIDGSWATCPTSETGLLRLLLNPAVTGRDFSGGPVLEVLRGMRGHPRWKFLPEDGSLADAAIDPWVLVGHRQVTDFHLVDVAARHGAVLATFDAGLEAALAPADRRHVVVWSGLG